MPVRPPAAPGQPYADIDTPALVVDLDAYERNLKRLSERVARYPGIVHRAHAKTHKSPIIARHQMAHGAIGVCCQKVSEAEVQVEGGVPDVLVSNEVVGRQKLERLAALTRQARISICTDNIANVKDLAAAASKLGVRLDTRVEIDVGAGRCGIRPGDEAVALAQAVAREPSLRFVGLQAYQGRAQHIRSYDERRQLIARASELAADTRDRLKRVGLACEVIGGAGTGTFEFEAGSGVYTELQAGSYIFMDADYARNKVAGGKVFDTFEHALFVLAAVMSVPTREQAVVDAGLKSFSFDSGPPEPVGLAEVTYGRPSDEHGCLDMTRSNARLGLGDRVLLIPGHCDPTINMHDWYVAVRGLGTDKAHVEAVWPVAARGALF